MARRRRPGSDRGAAAVEMALVLPLLLLLVFGIIDFGRMLNAQIRLTEAAREVARAEVLGEEPEPRFTKVMDGMPEDKVDFRIVDNCDKATAADDAKATTTYRFKFVTPVAVLAGILPGGSAGGEIAMKATGVMPCRA